MVKLMNEHCEMARVVVRKVRQEYMKEIDEAEKGGISQDDAFRRREEAEIFVKDVNAKIEEIRVAKEKELMTV